MLAFQRRDRLRQSKETLIGGVLPQISSTAIKSGRGLIPQPVLSYDDGRVLTCKTGLVQSRRTINHNVRILGRGGSATKVKT